MSKVKTPWGAIGYPVYKRTYSRRLKENDPNSETEEFEDTVDRIIEGCDKQLKIGFTKTEEQEVKDMILGLEGIVAGRFLWQLGTRTVKNLGLPSLQNCAAVVVNDPIKPFTWAMDMLMLGSGVGYNIQREHVYELPKPKKVKITHKDTNDADFIVPDSREGWIELLRRVLESHFITGRGFSYSTKCIRGKGTPIKGFGGLASGPEDLCIGMERVNSVINNRAGKKIRPIDALDIMNIIGAIVVSGNVRRSAQIALGDCDDVQFLRAKRWDLGNIPNWRAMSNNSVVCSDMDMLPEEFWEGYRGNGEPYGLINLKNIQKQGRTGDTQYPDPEVQIVNPCSEQGLANFETCCLSELFLPNIKTEERLHKVIKYLYRINKHSLRLKCHLKDTESIVHKNMRMGIGVTGYLQASEKQRKWLPKAYKVLREYDKEYSKKHGFPESIKLTTVKPSGTLSLLAGVTPGCHPAFSQYYIRRMRMAANIPLVNDCRKAGYKVEFQRNFDGTENTSTVVVEFPVSHPKGTKLAAEMSAIDQLEVVKRLQKDWSDNAVSVTVYYKKEELKGIQKWLKENYQDNLKTVSFLLHADHGFDQAPMEEISKKEYDKLVKDTKPITSIKYMDDMLEDDCDGGACPIR